ETAAGENDFRMVANALSFVGQVVGIDANAVATDQTGTERQAVPLGTGGREYGFGVDTHLVDDDRQFVDQRDVEITLCVLYDLGSFGALNAACLVGADSDDFVVQRINPFGSLL